MGSDRTLRVLLPRPIRRFPADLTAVLAVTALTNAVVFLPVLRDTPLRPVLGAAFLLFVPGYAFVVALFPESSASDNRPTGNRLESTAGDPGELSGSSGGLTGVERVALTVGSSVAIGPSLLLVLDATPWWGIHLVPVVVTLTAFVIGSTAVAAVRRWQLPPENRFRVPYRTWLETSVEELFGPRTRLDVALNVVLIGSIVLALGSVGVFAFVPTDGERYSASYVLTEDEDGELVMDGYPSELERGQGHEVVAGIDNEEHRSVEYTVVVAEQRMVHDEDDESVVAEQRELDRFEAELAHGESWHQPHEIEPTMTGDIRIVWLLYLEDVPEDRSIATATDHSHLQLSVTEPAE